MAKSLIEELPRIVSEGRREAAQILERLSSGTQIGLQTNELVLPSKDVSGLFKGSTPQIPNAFTMAGGLRRYVCSSFCKPTDVGRWIGTRGCCHYRQ